MRLDINYVDAETALGVIQSGNRVFVHGSACTPLHMMRSLAKQKDRLRGGRIGVYNGSRRD